MCDPTQATCECINGTCPSGLQCVGGLCIKSGCDYTYQCGQGKVCDNGACVLGCGTGSACPTGYTCSHGACSIDTQNPECSATKPCPTGEICGPNGLCTNPCTSNDQCPTGEVCDGTAGTCVPSVAPLPPCTSCPLHEVCEADGFCHYPCTTVAECTAYTSLFVACDQGICKTAKEVNPQCTQSMPCPAGKSCISNICF